MPATPFFSVLVNCYNSATYLREAIDSVYAQTETDWELIFWDNQSTDASASIAQSYTDGRLRYFRAPTFLPLGPARNEAMAQARGEYLAFLDSDDVWTPTKLALQRAAITAAPTPPGLVFGDMVEMDASGHIADPRGRFATEHIKFTDDLLATFLINTCNPIGMSATVMCRQAYEDGIRFKPYRVAEEYDVWLQVARRYPAYARVNEVVMHYRVHGNSVTSVQREENYSESVIILDELLTELAHTPYHALARTRAAYAHRRYGHWLLAERRGADARAHMAAALRLAPGDPYIWWGVTKSYLKRLLPARR